MKLSVLGMGLVFVGVTGIVGCEKLGIGGVKLETDVQKASYAIGQQLGQNFKNQKVEIDADVLAASIKEVVEGKTSRLKPEEMQAAMQKLQENMMKKGQEEGKKNLEEGKTFLEKNKTEKDVKTTGSGLQYAVMKEGEGKSPGLDDRVIAHYKGTLLNGHVFDSSYDRGQPAEFPVTGVIKGWTEALQMMKKGTKLKLFVPPELGYGEFARGDIPANSVLVFEVELVDIKNGEAPKKVKK